MASVNKVILIGNLGRDPETRYLPSGDAVTNISIATSEKWKDKSGEQQEHTEWHRIAFFGKLAEIVGEYMKKGSPIYVEGKLRTRKYEKDGQDHYATEIIGSSVQFLGGRPENGGSSERGQGKPQQRPNGQPPRQAQQQGKKGGGAFDNMDDDIPFAPIGRGISGHAR